MKRFNQKGAALVSAVAVAALLTITATAFLRIASNESINEALSLHDDQAFFAGESGLLLGVRWLRQQNLFPDPGQSFTPFQSVALNSHWVDVTITIIATATTPSATITATVYNDAATKNRGTFMKRLSYSGVTQQNMWEYAHFFNSAPNVWAGHDYRFFDGPMHINEAICIFTQDYVKCTDRVTVANEIDDFWDYGYGNHHGNNYDYGVNINNPYSGMTHIETLDLIFQDQYLSNQDKIEVPAEFQTLAGDLLASPLSKINLPPSVEEGELSGDYRPTLRYNNDGSAVYNYYNGTGNDSLEIASVNEQIIISQNNINVHGTVNGNTTLVTPYGKSIFIVGDLVYSGYSPDLGNPEYGGIPDDNTSALGLVSGKHIVFHHEYVPAYGEDEIPVQGSLFGANQLHVTGSLIALMEKSSGGPKWWGTELWNKSRTYAFDYFFTGSHLLCEYEDPSTAGGSGGGANDTYYRWDRRFMNGIAPYGFPGMAYLQTQGGLIMVTLGNWTEENTY